MTQLDINNIDFTPYYFRAGFTRPAVMSRDEHNFINSVLGIDVWVTPRNEGMVYIEKLYTYLDRFNNHMPGPLRIALLKDMVAEHECVD